MTAKAERARGSGPGRAQDPWEEVPPQQEEDQRWQGAIFRVESTAELSVADTATNNTEPAVCTQGNWELAAKAGSVSGLLPCMAGPSHQGSF